LDSAFAPWTDQWAFLASVRKISRSQVEQIVEDAERRGRILGVRLPPQSMRLSTYNKPRVVACAEDLPHHIGLPRGCLNDVRKTLIEPGVRLAIRDERCDGSRLE
jgi:hypothetical protein